MQNLKFYSIATSPKHSGEYLAQVSAAQDVDFTTVIAVQYRNGAWWCPTVLTEQADGTWVFRAYDVSHLVQGWAHFPFGLSPLEVVSDIGYADVVEQNTIN